MKASLSAVPCGKIAKFTNTPNGFSLSKYLSNLTLLLQIKMVSETATIMKEETN